MPLFRRKRRKQGTNARARLFEIAADVYEDGDDKQALKAKMIAEIESLDEGRPFLRLMLQLLSTLLPLLLKGLAGAVLLACLVAASDASACERCGLFGNRCAFRQKVVVQHQAYAYPLIYPQINYFVGAPIRAEAVIQKALRDDPEYQELQKFKQWKALAAQAEAHTAPAPTVAPELTLVMQKCGSCHKGDKPPGGITFDGRTAIDDATFRAFSRMYLTGQGIPAKMKPILEKLTPEEGSDILAELLSLEAAPEPVRPEPPPEPQPGVLE